MAVWWLFHKNQAINVIDIPQIFLIQGASVCNPAVRCPTNDRLGYAVWKTGVSALNPGLKKTELLAAIKEGNYGDCDVLREFKANSGGSKIKKRCFTFRRAAIPEQMRKRLDKGLKLICLLAFKGRGENFQVQSYWCDAESLPWPCSRPRKDNSSTLVCASEWDFVLQVSSGMGLCIFFFWMVSTVKCLSCFLSSL